MKKAVLKDFQKGTLSFFDDLPRGELLDIAAGHGDMALDLKSKGFNVTCCDINPEYLDDEGIKTYKVDLNIDKLPFPDNSFDYILFSETIQYIENPHLLVREIKRVIKRGGTFVSTFPNTLNIQSRIKFLINGYPDFFKPVYKVPEDEKELQRLGINPVDLIEYKFILERYGFNIVSVQSSRTKKGFLFYSLIVLIINLLTYITTLNKNEEVRSVKMLLNSWTVLMNEGLLIVGEIKP